jgi:DNA replication and repair protein RecF
MLKHLSLTNYRNHKKFDLDFSDITVLIGKNGVGKTNILESIGVIGYGRSFRGENRLDLIRLDADYTRIIADDLEVFIQKSPRLIFQSKERGVKRKIADFIGLLPVVIFSPESLEIVTGEPKERRRFLDILISQHDHQYFRALLEYKKVLMQRNNLLKRISEGSAQVEELDFWDLELARLAKIITKKRLEVVSDFSDQLTPLYRLISGNEDSKLEIIYHPKADDDFITKLAARRSIDIAAGLTLTGPHRDDLVFKLNDLEADKFASRGELRSAVLALKIAELKYLENDKKPMLLLDDIFSEFDADRRSHLFKLIKNYQTLITTTDKEHLSKELLKSASVIEIVGT